MVMRQILLVVHKNTGANYVLFDISRSGKLNLGKDLAYGKVFKSNKQKEACIRKIQSNNKNSVYRFEFIDYRK